ncbi:hypothetical protein ACLOJK_015386 [Asimina triloba]
MGMATFASVEQQSDLMGFETSVEQLLAELTEGGEDGAGKSRIVRRVCKDWRVRKHFDLCAWINLPQEYEKQSDDLQLSQLPGQLGLEGKRFLLVVNDILQEQIFLPNTRNGSRVLLFLSRRSPEWSTELPQLSASDGWEFVCKRASFRRGCELRGSFLERAAVSNRSYGILPWPAPQNSHHGRALIKEETTRMEEDSGDH